MSDTEQNQSDSQQSPLRPSHNLQWSDPMTMIATVCGTGFLPKAPGTWASALALPLAWFIMQSYGQIGLLLATLAAFLLGIWASARLTRSVGLSDPSYIVIDEVVGQWIALWAIEPDLLLYGIAFVLFRLADIVKPWPVSWAERRLPGAFGVMMDDVVAGAFAGLVVYGLSVWM